MCHQCRPLTVCEEMCIQTFKPENCYYGVSSLNTVRTCVVTFLDFSLKSVFSNTKTKVFISISKSTQGVLFKITEVTEVSGKTEILIILTEEIS